MHLWLACCQQQRAINPSEVNNSQATQIHVQCDMPSSPACFLVAFAATVNGLLAPPTAHAQRPWGRKSKRLRHAVGTSPEKPPAFKDWPSPCHNNLCPCRASPTSPPTWISYWCHHTGVPLIMAKQAPCQDGRSCNGRGTCAVGAHCIADGNPTEMGLALTCSRCNYLAHGREFLNTTDDKGCRESQSEVLVVKSI